MVGPTVQDDLFSLLIKFRSYKIALTANITKMYRQFKMSQNDCKYHRIFWRDNPEEFVKLYELQTVTYGTASASFLSTRCLQEFEHQESHSFPEAVNVALTDFYVDNLLTP